MAQIIPYLFTKDIRRLTFLLIAWLIIIALESFLYALLALKNIAYQIFIPMFFRLVQFLETLLLIASIPLVIQDEPLVGTTAFWFTRPLSRQGVLATKTLFITIFFIVFPLLAELIVLIVNNVSPHLIVLAIPEILIERTALILPMVLLASITERFGRYAIGGVIIFGVFIIFGIAILILTILFPKVGSLFSGSQQMMMSETLRASAQLVQNLLVIILFGSLVVHQYLTRNTARSIRWAVVATFLIMVAHQVWTYDFMKTQQSENQVLPIKPNDIKVNFDLSHVDVENGFQPQKMNMPTTTKVIRSRLIVSGLPSKYFTIADTKSSIQMWYPNGTRLTSDSVNFQSGVLSIADDSLMMPLQTALGDVALINPIKNKFVYNEIFQLSPDGFEAYKNKPGTYAVDVDFDIYDFKVTSVLPLHSGQRDFLGSKQIIIYDVLEQSHGLDVVLLERDVNMIFDPKKSKTSIYSKLYDSGVHEVYLLRNMKRKEAVLQSVDESDNMKNTMTDMFNEGLRLKVHTTKLSFNFNEVGVKVDKDWLKDAELIRVEAKKQGVVKKVIRITNFELPDKTTDPDPSQHYSMYTGYNREQMRQKMGGFGQ